MSGVGFPLLAGSLREVSLGRDRHRAAQRAPEVDRRASLGKQGWLLEPPEVAALMTKIRRAGTPLRDYAGVGPMYGIKTGCNEAFVIDAATRERLIARDARGEEVIKPYLRGQDISRWASSWAGQWMIFARHGIDIDAYPAVKAHLSAFRRQLEPKPDNWKLSNDKTFFLPTDDAWLLAALNSPLLWWFSWRHLVHLKDEALNALGYLMAVLPIASARAPDEVSPGAEKLHAIHSQCNETRRLLVDWCRHSLDIATIPNALRDPFALNPEQFIAAIRKARGKAKLPSAASLQHIREEHARLVAPMARRLAEAARLEWRLADLVNEAYGLTPDDVALMWRTAPPRMPIAPPPSPAA